eukprot:COSAG04_NODE_2495_length_4011_cov_2.445041_5_plen_150_part_00
MDLYGDIAPDELERMSGEARRQVLAALIYPSDDPGTELAALRNAAAYLACNWQRLFRDRDAQATAKLMIRVCELLVGTLCADSIEDAAEEMCRAQPVKRAAMLGAGTQVAGAPPSLTTAYGSSASAAAARSRGICGQLGTRPPRPRCVG